MKIEGENYTVISESISIPAKEKFERNIDHISKDYIAHCRHMENMVKAHGMSVIENDKALARDFNESQGCVAAYSNVLHGFELSGLLQRLQEWLKQE